MSLIDTIVAAFAPHDCLGCGIEGSLLCSDCSLLFAQLPERCYRCRKLSLANKTCGSCRSSSNLHTVQATTVYEFIAKELVWRLKFQGVQAAARLVAEQMTRYMSDNDVIIVHIPTATSRIRQRGYDHARLIARELAKQASLPCGNVLVRVGQHHQVGASREQRVTQLKTAFRVINPGSIKGRHIVLIDDVLTTGATMEAAARTLRAAGAARVDGLVFAQA